MALPTLPSLTELANTLNSIQSPSSNKKNVMIDKNLISLPNGLKVVRPKVIPNKELYTRLPRKLTHSPFKSRFILLTLFLPFDS